MSRHNIRIDRVEQTLDGLTIGYAWQVSLNNELLGLYGDPGDLYNIHDQEVICEHIAQIVSDTIDYTERRYNVDYNRGLEGQ